MLQPATRRGRHRRLALLAVPLLLLAGAQVALGGGDGGGGSDDEASPTSPAAPGEGGAAPTCTRYSERVAGEFALSFPEGPAGASSPPTASRSSSRLGGALKNASIAAGGVLPMGQDTGTAVVLGKKGELVLTGGADEAAIAAGVESAYTKLNLRYSQMAPLTTWDEVNTGTNLPAQVDIFSTAGDTFGGPAARLAQDCIRKVEVIEYPSSAWRRSG